ncbi:FAD-dependent oxidoreductase [Pseudolabrys sp. FHR47]|uniref:FAD-dependent oxidoreductase n=1 Tax=Pseudolabrys sp. FHR47 TaxID=2562284 RepID=UPI0010BE6E82|nr:FAD-dependent oxidoreductase [Pseudolabrys sp. FHR47]
MTALPLPKEQYDVVIIGAGPAGLAAASVAGKAGLSTLVLDENAQPGGQIFRAINTTPVKRRDVLGDDYWRGETLVAEARGSGATIVQGATVWSLDRDLQIAVSLLGQSQILKARRVIIATGALERPFPIPGWTLPGVMTVGAGQTLLKASGLVPDGKVVLAGTGPLLWLYAAQVLRGGGAIEAILDTTPRGNYWRALPHALPFLMSPYWTKGLALMREVKRRVRVVANVTSLAVRGGDRLNAVAYSVAGGGEQSMAADTLLLHQGVVPNVNLANAAGVAHRWDDRQLCWAPLLDADGNTSVPGIAIAGDGAGIGGAQAAVERGRIAALAAVQALAPGKRSLTPDRTDTAKALRRAERGRAFLDVLFQPASQFRLPDGDTIVCRCEEVTAMQIKDTIGLGVEGPNQLKAFLRCGMGPCQGRLCGLTVTEMIAQARGISPEAVGYYRLRPPVKPVALKELASIPHSEQAEKAVVRG